VNSLNDVYANPSESVGRVNRLIANWPSDDTLPAEGFDGVKTVYKKLVSGLQELKTNAEKETKYGRRTVICTLRLPTKFSEQ
jgi:SAGA-associated factor 29